jgi:acetoacetate decarboxylase
VSLETSLEQLAAASSETYSETYDVHDAETLFALWETSQETVERFLPPLLQPAQRPLALAMFSARKRTSIGPVYSEASLALRAEANGQVGFYFLSMPVTDSMALVFGRESLGYPRKVADIYFYHDGQNVGGWVQRHGVRYFAVHAQLTGSVDEADGDVALDEVFGSATRPVVMLAYSFKYFRTPSLDGFDYPPRLVCEEVEYRPRVIDRGPASVSLCPSEYDPWSEVEVVRMLGAVYLEGASSMRKAQLVSEVVPNTLAAFGERRIDLR